MGDLLKEVSGTTSRSLGAVTLKSAAELYLQCPTGTAGVQVIYGSAGESTCPPDGTPLVAEVSAAHYPVSLAFRGLDPRGVGWMLALDSHLLGVG